MNLTSILAIALWSALGMILWTDVLEGFPINKLHFRRAILFTIFCGPFAIFGLIIALLNRAINKLDLANRCTKWLTKEKL